MIFFFYGTDAYRAQQTIDQIKAKFKAATDPGGQAVHRLDPDNFSLETFFSLARSRGFLSNKSLIVLKNPFDYRLSDDEQGAVLDFLETQEDSTQEHYIIFWQQGSPDARRKLYKALQRFKYVQEFKQLESKALVSWIIKQAASLGRAIDAALAQELINRSGTNTWQLRQELEKLAAYSQQKSISQNDIEAVVSRHYDENVWPLVDAIGLRQRPRALALLNDQLAAGSDPHYLLAMISRQLQLLLRVSEALRLSANTYALAQQLKVPPFIAKKLQQQAAQFPPSTLAQIYQELLALEALLKRHPEQAPAAFTLMIERL